MSGDIPRKEKEDAFAAIAIAVMLLLTAWGNAIAMMVGSVIGLIILFVAFEGKHFRGARLAAVVALSVAAVLAVAFFLGLRL